MWQTYMIHEHRKDMLCIAEQIRLARLARGERQSLTRWLNPVFAVFRRPSMIEIEPLPCPQPCAEVGGAS